HGREGVRNGGDHLQAPGEVNAGDGRRIARFSRRARGVCPIARSSTMVPDRSTFENMYAGGAPWDIGKPQKPFVDAADRIAGRVLDAGCGTGDTALFLAGRGCTVSGIDFLEEPIRRAQRKAAERGVSATFLVKDAMMLKDWTERFGN